MKLKELIELFVVYTTDTYTLIKFTSHLLNDLSCPKNISLKN